MINFQKQFLALIPKPQLLVGDVLSVSGGIARIELPSGGILLARGAATVGQRVFVRDSVIEGPAPNLPYASAEV